MSCAICLSDWTADTSDVLPCAHVFHRACLAQWWARAPSHNSCPLCRYVIPPRRGAAELHPSYPRLRAHWCDFPWVRNEDLAAQVAQLGEVSMQLRDALPFKECSQCGGADGVVQRVRDREFAPLPPVCTAAAARPFDKRDLRCVRCVARIRVDGV